MTNKAIINCETGNVEESNPVFVDFNNYLRELGFNIAFTQFSDSNSLTIYVFSVEDVEKAKQISSKLSLEIIDAFFSIAHSYGHVLLYKRAEWKDYSIKNIYSFEIACIERLVRESKQQLASEIDRQLRLNPKYIFWHSAEEQNYSLMPGYYIVFDGPNELKKVDENVRRSISDICISLISQKDRTGYFKRYKVDVRYFDTITHSDFLYGMSRED